MHLINLNEVFLSIYVCVFLVVDAKQMMIDSAREFKRNEDDDRVTRDDDAHAYLYTHTYERTQTLI